MSCPSSVMSVLAAANPCPAQPASHRWVLADSVSESRCRPGMVVQANLQGVPARDSVGNHAHVRGILLRAGAAFSLGAGSAAIRGRDLRSLFQAITLQDVTGHTYLTNLDGRDLLDDNFFRHGMNLGWPALQAGTQDTQSSTAAPGTMGITGITTDIITSHGIPANPGVSPFAHRTNISMYHPLVNVLPGMNPLAGLIPLAAIQAKSGQGAFRFTVGRSILTTPGAAALVTFNELFNSFGEAGMEVWLELVYLPAVALNPAWVLQSQPVPDAQGVLPMPENTTEYAFLRYHSDDVPGIIGGETAVRNISGITVTTAGFTDQPGLQKQLASARTAFGFFNPLSAQSRQNAGQDLPLFDPAKGYAATTIALVPYRPRDNGAVGGPVNFDFADRGGNSFFRILQRSVSCNKPGHMAAVLDATNCKPVAAVMCDGKGNPTSGGQTNGVILAFNQ